MAIPKFGMATPKFGMVVVVVCAAMRDMGPHRGRVDTGLGRSWWGWMRSGIGVGGNGTGGNGARDTMTSKKWVDGCGCAGCREVGWEGVSVGRGVGCGWIGGCVGGLGCWPTGIWPPPRQPFRMIGSCAVSRWTDVGWSGWVGGCVYVGGPVGG